MSKIFRQSQRVGKWTFEWSTSKIIYESFGIQFHSKSQIDFPENLGKSKGISLGSPNQKHSKIAVNFSENLGKSDFDFSEK